MQFGYPYLIRLSIFEIQSDPDPVLNCRIRLDRDPDTGSCSTLVSRGRTGVIIALCHTLLNNGEVIMRTSHLLLRN